jgi:hypothetical protein
MKYSSHSRLQERISQAPTIKVSTPDFWYISHSQIGYTVCNSIREGLAHEVTGVDRKHMTTDLECQHVRRCTRECRVTDHIVNSFYDVRRTA